MPKGSRVLMADDDKMLIDMYKERLELAGYNVTICRNGEEALGKIREAKPEIILLDIMMPKINGYEALASIKSDPATKDIPVIMLSALMRDFNREKAVEAGADDYLIKSEAMPADVITKIEQVLVKYGKGTIPAPGQIAPNITAPSATPPVMPTPLVVSTAPVSSPIPTAAPMPATHVNTPVATLEPSVMQPDAIAKPEEKKQEDKVIFEPEGLNELKSPDSSPVAVPAKEENKEDEVPVVKLNQGSFETPKISPQPSVINHPPAPTMAWEPEPNKDINESTQKSPASVALIVVMAILLTALVNDILIYFFFLNK
ncbi:TPA: response regulator [Candidatus Berkelbacteria bacterium]|uniref:Response regulatory domain-containing protein n=1 Tax=Berkelbacteria bacterium GW2011_GWE1_39_12 TaxID=1618337 RepID=A0A0G4B500_9BACT|nr:MAG: hypothetical protein UT28_C0001G0261 [Berkelbacteria bacterium GW2011_GWE1_39_12]HBO60657.1 response regulator [Candidatus Berkelbacteria bacterium]